MSSGIKFCPTSSFASAFQLKKQSLRSCCCAFVYLLLVSVLNSGYLHFYKALSQFVQFVRGCVRPLECSPASCLALQNHCEEKHEKFITHRINNKVPSHFSFDTGTVLNFEKPARAYFFHLGE